MRGTQIVSRVMPWAIVVGVVCLLPAGCGYTTRGLYPENVRTVAVPIFKNEGLRRDIEFQLTERVIQVIESRTPFKVVSEENADTVLRGSVSAYYKQPFGEDGYDNPRGGVMILEMQVSWVDNHNGEIIYSGKQNFSIQASAPFAIDTAQSATTATQDTVDQMADRIVLMMQSPW